MGKTVSIRCGETVTLDGGGARWDLRLEGCDRRNAELTIAGTDHDGTWPVAVGKTLTRHGSGVTLTRTARARASLRIDAPDEVVILGPWTDEPPPRPRGRPRKAPAQRKVSVSFSLREELWQRLSAAPKSLRAEITAEVSRVVEKMLDAGDIEQR